jgi:hypothetical protein
MAPIRLPMVDIHRHGLVHDYYSGSHMATHPIDRVDRFGRWLGSAGHAGCGAGRLSDGDSWPSPTPGVGHVGPTVHGPPFDRRTRFFAWQHRWQ